MIEKIIVHLNNDEKTFVEFGSLADFLASDLYKGETATPETPVIPTQ